MPLPQLPPVMPAELDLPRATLQGELKAQADPAGEIASSIARELRNPLFSISSAAQLLRLRAGDDPVIEKHAGRILREVERLNRVGAALLEYGTPRKLLPVALDPDGIWDSVVAQNRGSLERRGLVLKREGTGRSATCAIDREQMQHALGDLLQHAAASAPEGSDLVFRSSTLRDGSWQGEIIHQGPPVPPDVAAHLFDLVPPARSVGSGVGLALCRRIVEAHGGTVRLESTPGGTVLSVVLPG